MIYRSEGCRLSGTYCNNQRYYLAITFTITITNQDRIDQQVAIIFDRHMLFSISWKSINELPIINHRFNEAVYANGQHV